ncbi:OmpA family protein [Marinobacter mobilis]|uniref:OmpA family protein n=1 Tax=Marinobacter mobilis TaxID=488533 RepID=A0A1H2PZ14_9GAMM|nr:OmpA family protein [Marinobacter mobilis]SDV99828.1 OmpA family protein [Marinobacter mobilis]
MSQEFHINRVQSARPQWRSALGALLVSGLVGCSATAVQPDSREQIAETELPPKTNVIIDQSPIAASPTTTNSDEQQQEPANHLSEEADMTVLVLDNPELLAKAAYLDHQPLVPVEDLAEAPRRPHRLRFHYGFDKHQLSEEDIAILREHAAYLQAHPETVLQIHGHTDNFGPEQYNTFLSRLRASSAARILREEGVRESQIRVSGWGSTRPLALPEDHAANRRLELEYRSEQMAKAQ